MITNNDILKKLRVALSLRNDDIIEILALVDFKISKGALGDLFRNEDHPGYVEAGDQILRNFLNGLIIYKRGKLPQAKTGSKEERRNSHNLQRVQPVRIFKQGVELKKVYHKTILAKKSIRIQAVYCYCLSTV